MRSYYTLLIISVLFTTSCKTLTPFSSALKINNNWTEAELKKIQFYNSEEIILSNQLIETKSEIKNGKIIIKPSLNSDSSNVIVIKKHTRGVLVKADSKNLQVSFENDDNHHLTFSLDTNKIDKQDDGHFYFRHNNGQVSYNGNNYFIFSKTNNITLLVQYCSKSKKIVKKHYAKGKKMKF